MSSEQPVLRVIFYAHGSAMKTGSPDQLFSEQENEDDTLQIRDVELKYS